MRLTALAGSAFNPTVVRLRRLSKSWSGTQSELSIPLWCDCDALAKHHGLPVSTPFNPTVVRLRRMSVMEFQRRWLAFNPTVVRLRPSSEVSKHSIPENFQSHCGAIATCRDRHPRVGLFCFQSHCGAIATHQNCQHSTYSTAFQSHCGAIATIWEFPPDKIIYEFQSHCGAIATVEQHCSVEESRAVSIPLWCDCDCISAACLIAISCVSIPLWCDCDRLWNDTVRTKV